MSDLADEFRRDIVSHLTTEPRDRVKLIRSMRFASTEIFDEGDRCRSLATYKEGVPTPTGANSPKSRIRVASDRKQLRGN